MDRHERVVLQQRVGPSPCVTPGSGDEGVGRPDHQPEEERGDDVEDEGGPADHGVGGLSAGSATRRRSRPPRGSRPHNRIEPASADHIPVMEYSSGVTVLLFSATNTSVKSWVTSACSMAPTSRAGRRRA